MNKENYKIWYSVILCLGVLTIPYIEFGIFPYSLDIFAYGFGFLLVPLIAGGIARLFKRPFINTFNVIGSLVFISALINNLT